MLTDRLSPVRWKIRFISPWLVIFILLSTLASPLQTASAADPSARLGLRLAAQLATSQPGDVFNVIVTMKDPLDPEQAAASGPGKTRQERLIRGLQAHADASQRNLRGFLRDPGLPGRVSKVTPFWVVDGLSLQATPDIILALAARPDVQAIELEEGIPAPRPMAASAVSTASGWDNLGKIGARQLWALGITGQNVVVASLDTGVDLTSPELQASWRGGTDSWYDPTGVHPAPTDLPADCAGAGQGHGTGTMSVMVGSTVGVAPGAKWIAAKIFEDNCIAYTTDILKSFQWVIDPDGNPATPDAPQMVNNSWGSTTLDCDNPPVYQAAIQALITAGITPVFAAGNFGSVAYSGVFPATDPGAFPVGATDSSDVVAYFSSRGPNKCTTPNTLFPALTAPGVGITMAGLGGTYVVEDGTSFSAPHVSGSLALLLSASPGMTVQAQEAALEATAVDLGTPGIDNNYGYGRINVLAAAQQLLPSKLSFTSTSFSILENGGQIIVGLQLTPASSKTVTVSFSAAGGSATPGVDYVLPGPVTFNPGETSKTISVPIVDDTIPEPDETFQIRMANPVNAIPSDPSQVLSAAILDNDIQVGFALTTISVDEASGSISLGVTRDGFLALPVSVTYSVTGGTGLAGVNYDPAAGTLDFAAGQTQQTIQVTVLHDLLPSPDRTLILALSNPQFINPSGVQTAVINIAPDQVTLTIHNIDLWQINLPCVLR